MSPPENPRTPLADAALLAGLAVLSPLGTEALYGLAGQALARRYGYRQEIAYREDDRERTVLGVVEGEVCVGFLSSDGKELPILVVDAGHVVELGSDGWAGSDITTATVRSEYALVCSLPSRAFESAVVACPEASRTLLLEQRRWIRRLGGVASDRLHDPASRVRHALWRDVRDTCCGSVHYTHEELAAWACTERSRVTKVLGELRRDGIIEVDRKGRRIVVRRPEQLLADQ